MEPYRDSMQGVATNVITCISFILFWYFGFKMTIIEIDEHITIELGCFWLLKKFRNTEILCRVMVEIYDGTLVYLNSKY